MKRLSSAILAVVVCSLFFTSNASAWCTDTHMDITEKSIKLLETDQRSSTWFYKDKYNDLSPFLYEGCCFISQSFASTKLSAKARFKEHYSNAINEYKNNNMEKAFIELGRACHYIQNIACTPHSAGIFTSIINVNVYEEYEKYVDFNLFSLSSSDAYTASEVYDYMQNNSIGEVLNELSMITSSYKDDLLSADEGKYYEIACATLPLAQKYTAAVLDMFANDVSYL